MRIPCHIDHVFRVFPGPSGIETGLPSSSSGKFAHTHLMAGASEILGLCKLLPPIHSKLDIETKVKQAQFHEPGLSNVPSNGLFVPHTICFQVLEWGHSFKLSCHPGTTQTLSQIQQCFWWPSSKEDVSSFVAAYDICIRNKCINTALAGLQTLTNHTPPLVGHCKGHTCITPAPKDIVLDCGPQFTSQF